MAFESSPFVQLVADLAVRDAGPWLVEHREHAHANSLEYADAVKYRTMADKVLDIKLCTAIFDAFGEEFPIFSEER